MKIKTRILIVLTGILMVSCYKPYTAKLDNNEKILVVDGLITNRADRHYIKLGYSSQFYSSGEKEALRDAIVSVTDNKGSEIFFRETDNGNYVSESSEFTAKPGDSYVLKIATPGGDVYESTPQKMETEYEPDSVYAVNDYQQYISKFNQVLKKLTGAKILLNIVGGKTELPKFRIDVELLKFYTYGLYFPPPNIDPPLYMFYCWQLDNPVKDLVLASPPDKSASSIENQSIYFVDNLSYMEGIVYWPGNYQANIASEGIPTGERNLYNITGRVMYIDLYTLNDDAYLYYKRIKDQITAEGKLFDPISVRMEGNVRCITDPEKPVLGFFEVSALSQTAWYVGLRNPSTDQIPVRRIPRVNPVVPDGCQVNEKPPFWIY